MKKILIFYLPILFFAPFFVFAASVSDVIETIGEIISALIPIVAALALLFFFWGLAKYILNAGDETAKTEGRNIMIWGIIALFVMFSVWGLVEVLQNTFSVGGSSAPTLPEIPGGGGFTGNPHR